MLGKLLGGRYQITGHLGGGGFGTTFLAEDKHLPGNPRCVIKQFQPKGIQHPSALQAARRLFDREAEVLYQLGTHDRIPQLFAHFEEEQEFYLVQQFIEGHELRQELQVGRSLSENVVIAILRDVLGILEFVHQQNVIHRDIKPSNLIRRRQDGKVVLIDFGAVKQIASQTIISQGETSLTIAIGSPGYMPNEQIAGKPRFCSDIYAVGMLGIQALRGKHPKQLEEHPTTSEIVWREDAQVTSELADVLDKMVRYDFRQRYQSVGQVLSALNSVTLKAGNFTLPVTPENYNINSLPTETITLDEQSPEQRVDYSQSPNLLTAKQGRKAEKDNMGLIFIAANSRNSVKSKIVVVEGDITKQQVDAIVNSTGRSFLGGEVSRAIHRAAGHLLMEACFQLNGCDVGEAKITSGFDLPARWIIHTVAPKWRGNNSQDERMLAQCYRSCLALAEKHSIKTIAFPAISTGGRGFPIERASQIAVSEVKFFLERYASMEKVIFVCRGKMAYDGYLKAVREILSNDCQD